MGRPKRKICRLGLAGLLWLGAVPGALAAGSGAPVVQNEWPSEKAELVREAETLAEQVRQLDQELTKTEKYTEIMVGKVQELRDGLEKQEQLLPELEALLRSGTRRLKEFADTDLPFESDRRQAGLSRVASALDDPDLSAGAKVKLFLEALYQEMEYGYRAGLETTTAEIEGEKVQVRQLHYGRLGLLAQSLDGSQVWHWNRPDRKFYPVDGYGRAFRQAKAMVLQHHLAELIRLPLDRALDLGGDQ